MMNQGSEMQVLYLEVEGIKIALKLTKYMLDIAWQLAKFIKCSLADAKYKKSTGKTNIKNLKARANGTPLVPTTMDKKTFVELKKMAKKYGILFTAFHPLGSGKRGSVEVIIAEKDIPMMNELLSRIKEKRVREDVKNGMDKETASREFDENNRTETMDEFAENLGVVAPKEVFEAKMKERFGENYEEMIDPKGMSAGLDEEKVNDLADVIKFSERARKVRKDYVAEIQFVYDEKQGKGQIVEETETHVKIEGKGFSGEKDKWEAVWIPKDAIFPPLDKDAGAQGTRSAYLKPDTDIVIEDPTGKTAPVSGKVEQFYSNEHMAATFVAEGVQYQTAHEPQDPGDKDITISKELIYDETKDAIKTKVPGTWGNNVRYLWIEKKDIIDVYGGKSMLTHLSEDKEYDLYSEAGNIAITMKGKDLYRNHYEPVNSQVRKNANMKAAKAERGRKL